MFDLLMLLFGPGLFVTILWSPILLVRRFRALFARVPPTGSVGLAYVLVAVGLSVPFVLGTVAVLATTSVEGATLSNALLNTAFLLTIAYLLAAPALAGVGLPRLGVDWDPTGYGLGTWLLLVGATVWYVAVFVLPLALFALVLALPTG
ncbi:hypothetical protein DM868_13025 [Natronomonas salsuginis]|jgi:hypothetical protein|uniref:DUF8162 domain-containing protein n=2 Tax=Natronomonas salsuginis TaxID=2217661 RepID=A0A4U5J743_9EURY|nr:hypothetical protein DM868_13025 [Natronomonas salsuginis]